MTSRSSFQTTSARGLNHNSPPMRLWHKAKKLGIWDPRDIDFTKDREDWLQLNDEEKEVVLHLTSTFQAGEEAVTLDLLPLIATVAQEGRLEEEMYLTSFLWEEAKHVEAFRRFTDEVVQTSEDLSRFHTPNYKKIFYEELPQALERLWKDKSPIAQVEASVTYNMIVEGVLAETGYHAYFTVLRRNGIMPGMQQTVEYLKRDESRHLAYGVFLLSRLVAEHGDDVWQAIENRLNLLLQPALGVVTEIFSCYEVMPFGLELNEFTDFAMGQYQKRFSRISRARTQTLEEIMGDKLETEEVVE